MDEPFGALDPITRAGVRKDFSELDELRSTTIILVTHDVQEAFELADRIFLMDKGVIVQQGTPDQLLFEPAGEYARDFFEEQRFQLEAARIGVTRLSCPYPGIRSFQENTALMDQSESLWQFMQQQSGKLLQQTFQHIGLTFISLLIAVLIGLPLGIYITRHRRAAGVVLGIAGVLQTIPSLALLGFMIPLLGIGPVPAITALFLYALLPVIRNTYTGIDGVDPGVGRRRLRWA